MWENINNTLLPEALAMGVGYDEFWYFTPSDLKPFVRAFEIKQGFMDDHIWGLGQYIQIAIGSMLSKDCKYPDKPFSKMDKNVLPEKKAEQEMENIKSKFLARMELINTRFETEE